MLVYKESSPGGKFYSYFIILKGLFENSSDEMVSDNLIEYLLYLYKVTQKTCFRLNLS